jgi:DNA polymerase-3 subunit epsilon
MCCRNGALLKSGTLRKDILLPHDKATKTEDLAEAFPTPASSPLAFVDLETTGLSPRTDRIAEIGIVAVHGQRVEEWSTLLNPRIRTRERSQRFDEPGGKTLAAAPCFKDIAAELAERLAGRIFIAHNARFDHAFLKAEFENAGIDFRPRVLCSAMLSRKLNGQFAHHDMDTLMARHHLAEETRHRALPDARLVWQFWQALHREHEPQTIANSLAQLLAGPVLPADLDPVLIDRLPERPGVYLLHGEKNEVLQVGSAGNLRLRLVNYFRVDHMSAKASEVALLVRNITWQATQGLLGARLQAAVLSTELLPAKKRRSERELFCWQLTPDDYPCARLVHLSHGPVQDCFGIFHSASKARNAMLRLAASHRLCHCLLGIGRETKSVCLACPEDERGRSCGRIPVRLKQLARSLTALNSWQRPTWPYPGPVGIRERADLHIVREWRYLGTARTEPEMFDALECRLPAFNEEIFQLLARILPRLPRKKLLDLSEHEKKLSCSARSILAESG